MSCESDQQRAFKNGLLTADHSLTELFECSSRSLCAADCPSIALLKPQHNASLGHGPDAEPLAHCLLFQGAVGTQIEFWRTYHAIQNVWFSHEQGLLIHLVSTQNQLHLRAWVGYDFLAQAVLRVHDEQEWVCAEHAKSIACQLERNERIAAAFDTLLSCSSRCSPCAKPSFFRRLFLK